MFKQHHPYLPSRCLLCQLNPCMPNAPLCTLCAQDMPWFGHSFQRHECTISAACHYEWPVNRLIHLYKYQQRLDLLPVLSYLLAQQSKPKVHAIVPVPIAKQRLKTRGYHHTLLLAQQLSKQWQIPVWQPLARHNRSAQQTLSASERLLNTQHAFYPVSHRSKVVPRRVLIIDDVVTTGSTLFYFSHALHNIGVQYCQRLVIAQAT